MKPRFGLMRAKEFIMKDLYTFDDSLTNAHKTYEEVNDAYLRIFNHIGVPYVKVEAGTGVIGGSTSHEYHFPCDIGEDRIAYCKTCNLAMNQEKILERFCHDCGNKNIIYQQGIEVGHTFVLEDKYSKVLEAKYLSAKGKPVVCQMGCYGIGVTRIIAASLEVLSTDLELRWPLALAPFKICIITPKKGSKEEAMASPWVEKIYNAINVDDDVVVDDLNLTIGKRIMEAKKTGYPFVIVVGQMAAKNDPKFELHLLNENKILELDFNSLVSEVLKLTKIVL
jgi:prolyl-tRNA synthetase